MCSEHVQRCYWDNLYCTAACSCLMFKYFQICKYLHVCDWAVAFLTLNVKLFVRVCPEFETRFNPRHISKYWALNTGKTRWPGKNWDRLNTSILYMCGCFLCLRRGKYFQLLHVPLFNNTVMYLQHSNGVRHHRNAYLEMYSESLISNLI